MIMITLQSKKSYKFWFPCMWNCFHLFGWSTLLCKNNCLLSWGSVQWFFLSLSGFSFFKINVSWLATCTSESLRILEVKIINIIYSYSISRKVVGKMCTRQSQKVIWDMINTLFLMTVPVKPTFVAFL